MTGVFRANNPINTFMLFVYGLLLKLEWFIHPQIPVIQKADGFLYNQILGALKPALDKYPTTYTVITFLLLYTQAISFNQLLNNRRLIQKPNYLAGMSYLLITSFFTEWNVLSAPLVINTLLIWIWAKMSSMYNNPHVKSTLYNIGMAVGVATFFYFPAIAFALLIIFALILIRPPRVAEWIIALLGIATPWYFLFAWLFLNNQLYSFQVSGIHLSYPVFVKNNVQFTGIALIALTAIAGGWYVQSNIRRQIVQVRKSWGLTVLYLVVSLFIPFINTTHNLQYWILAAVPLSAFIACFFFYPTKKILIASIHWIMAAFAIYMTYFRR